MIKTVFKLLIAALLANAVWHVGSAFMVHYKFQDAVTELAQFSVKKSEEELQGKVLELASQYEVPLSVNNVSVKREMDHTIINANYRRPIEVVPGYVVPWDFKVHVDTLSFEGNQFK